MSNIFKITNSEDHLRFLKDQNFNIYVQHPLFGEFNQNLGDEYFCFSGLKNNQIVISSLCILIKAKRGNFLYLPYGPIFKDHSIVKDYFSELKNLAKQKGCNFVRISPFLDYTQQNLNLFKSSGFTKSPMHMIAENTCVLDLKDKTKDEVLKGMNKNHRNLIKKSLKTKELEVKVSSDSKDIKILHDLLIETSKRHGFTPFSLEYLKQEFDTFKKIKAGKIYIAYYNSKPIAASIFYQFCDTKVYKHGASLSEFRNVPASYLIQWTSILDAINDNIHNYNFWGVAPSKEHKNHPFYGITHFKMGFGSKQIDLIPALDLPINMFYWFNWIIETLRRKKRGF